MCVCVCVCVCVYSVCVCGIMVVCRKNYGSLWGKIMVCWLFMLIFDKRADFAEPLTCVLCCSHVFFVAHMCSLLLACILC